MKRNKRKGATLAEMCIVMAVVAIVSLSVTSFATMASGRGTAAATKLDAMGDLEIVEAVVESWIAEAVKQESEIQVPGNNDAAIGINENDLIRVRKNGWMEVSFPGENEILDYRLKSVVGLTIEKEPGTDGVNIYFCTVHYEYRNGIVTKPATYTFCVYPRVGEIVS